MDNPAVFLDFFPDHLLVVRNLIGVNACLSFVIFLLPFEQVLNVNERT